jgi:hypothetical protein
MLKFGDETAIKFATIFRKIIHFEKRKYVCVVKSAEVLRNQTFG